MLGVRSFTARYKPLVTLETKKPALQKQLKRFSRQRIGMFFDGQVNLNPTAHSFQLLNTNPKAERPPNKQQIKRGRIKAWKSISKSKTQTFGDVC